MPTITAGSRTSTRPWVCGCGHATDAHYRRRGVCRKVLCPCNGYRAESEAEPVGWSPQR